MSTMSEDPNEEDTELPAPKSTSRPLAKKRKAEKKSNEDIMVESAVSYLSSRSKRAAPDADELFGQSIGMSLKQINNDGVKEYVKMKMHELMFKAKTGQMNYIFQPSSGIQSPPLQNLQNPLHNLSVRPSTAKQLGEILQRSSHHAGAFPGSPDVDFNGHETDTMYTTLY